eukprot:Nk52_evm25s2657 gene=Nk52_evmTU25s2657
MTTLPKPLFGGRFATSIIAMVHLRALPGTPRHFLPVESIYEQAVKEARVYVDHGVDALLVENMHDIPYVMADSIGPEVVAPMSVALSEIKRAVNSSLPIGCQILAGANKEAMAAALAGGCDFIRAEGFAFAHVADEGIMNGCAGELLRYRRQIGADHIKVFTDVKKKHSSHAITADLSIEEYARGVQFFDGDGVIVTGTETGAEASLQELQKVRESVSLPLIVGSGVTACNITKYYGGADGLIVGSHFKENGLWYAPVDPNRVKDFMVKVKEIRERFG